MQRLQTEAVGVRETSLLREILKVVDDLRRRGESLVR